jgi:hypothetical protein
MKPSRVDILARLKDVRRNGTGWTAKCPAHEDGQNSLSISRGDGKWLVHCHAGCGWQEIIAAIGVLPRDLFDDQKGGGGCLSPKTTTQPCNHPHRLRG